MATAKYKRIMLKLSGEAFKGTATDFSIDGHLLDVIARQIKQVRDAEVVVGIVIGGGNIWRGAEAEINGMDRVAADYAGMLATVINALVLQDVLVRNGVATHMMSAINMPQVAEPYIIPRALKHLAKGRVVLFSGGTGNPYVTTDTAAALRAIEMKADVLLMAKNKVDGVYNADPRKHPEARKYEQLSYLKALNMRLEVMDATALSLCMGNNLPIVVFDLQAENSIVRVATGEHIGTMVGNKDD
ncbi:MAG: UMP kinase [Chloroflexota bacterium]